ncbi:TIM barrel protein [Arthrobacter sp. JZ12]|uniref:hydroxypyruvate isomerase family protein n=1 Tax=Arthrobacter sp. JZ12 TaxID=2654190 RepID=UPI002B4A2DC3|nr:TIM barrel protein [Arthrobacter sp. JZ12]WRH24245.1 TIM barrel protein [Arthrobacter sp. JZ12]
MIFTANISILFTELPLLERPAAARAAGFRAVECWWPFEQPVPTRFEVDSFLAALDRAGVALSGLNFFAGDMSSGDRGILSHPDQREVFDANLDVVHALAQSTGCRSFNALYGQRLPGIEPAEQEETAIENLKRASAAVAPFDGQILLEPLTGGENGDYPLLRMEDALAVVDRVGSSSVKLLFDAYHLHNNGHDVTQELKRHAERIGHVQIADSPGRGQPGTGRIDFQSFFSAVESSTYEGLIGCEYRPQGPTVQSFEWMRQHVA